MTTMTLKDTVAEYTGSAIRFWEAARIPFNIALLFVVVSLVGPQTLLTISEPTLLTLVALAIVANILYCAAYALDFFLQSSDLSKTSIYLGRFAILGTGTLFAMILTYFTIMSANTAVPNWITLGW